jgi:transposase
MSSTRNRRRPRARRRDVIQKPRGTFHPRVQKVGPEHFGIVTFDPHKARSKWMLCDFFGNVLIAPTQVAHNRTELDQVIAQIRQVMASHPLHDILVAIERTGRYHRPVQRACTAAGFDTRIVHPFATKQFRQAQDPGDKTDDTDLVALHHATVQGCALLETPLDESWRTLQLLIRHRRDLVRKNAILCCQIREHLDAALPGFAACFGNFWNRDCAWQFVQQFTTAPDMHAAGRDGLCAVLHQAGIRFQQRTLEPVLDWAAHAAPGDVAATQHHAIALALNEDRLHKTQEIQALERTIAGYLVQTPYVLLLSFPGLNVVSSADFAGEMGPMPNYANSRAITGRAGLRPSRAQSDAVDHANGPLLRCCNHALRAAILEIADNLITCNHHFNVLAHHWQADGKDPRHTRVKVGLRFCRIAFQMVAGQQVFHHPAIQGRHYILDKLTAFHRAHGSDAATVLRDLQATIAQLPKSEHAAEARPLHEELENIQNGRRRGPQLLGDILPLVLARLGAGVVQSKESGEEPRT